MLSVSSLWIHCCCCCGVGGERFWWEGGREWEGDGMEASLYECVCASLRVYMYRNATFLCERLCAEFPSEVSACVGLCSRNVAPSSPWPFLLLFCFQIRSFPGGSSTLNPKPFCGGGDSDGDVGGFWVFCRCFSLLFLICLRVSAEAIKLLFYQKKENGDSESLGVFSEVSLNP
jgi:hypothetical protein